MHFATVDPPLAPDLREARGCPPPLEEHAELRCWSTVGEALKRSPLVIGCVLLAMRGVYLADGRMCARSMSWNGTYDTNGWLPRRHLLSPFVGPYRHDIDLASSPVVVQNHSPPRRPIDCAAEPLVVYQVGSQASHLRPTSTSATTPKRLATAIAIVSLAIVSCSVLFAMPSCPMLSFCVSSRCARVSRNSYKPHTCVSWSGSLASWTRTSLLYSTKSDAAVANTPFWS